jgi:predicted unusual protein kinase regulating ubiquinone biosynthesis (AarF/ABC1/UbiB family)
MRHCVVCSQIATDVVGLVDEWAARFFEELDYIHEGENATKFAASMAVDLPQVCICISCFSMHCSSTAPLI